MRAMWLAVRDAARLGLRTAIALAATVFWVGLVTFVVVQSGREMMGYDSCKLDAEVCKQLVEQHHTYWPRFNCVSKLQPFRIDLRTCSVDPARTQFFAFMFFARTSDGRIEPGVFLGGLGWNYRQRDHTNDEVLFTAPPRRPFTVLIALARSGAGLVRPRAVPTAAPAPDTPREMLARTRAF